MKSLRKLAWMIAAWPWCASAADIATLKNGFTIRHERRETMGESTRLYLKASDSGYIDVATEQIAGIEADPLSADSLPAAAPMTAPIPDLHQSVAAASRSTGVDPDLIESVILAESGYHAQAVSRKGAQGLMQLMPQTAERLGVKNAFDPDANIQGGSRYLRDLLLQYKSDLARALAAYNAGPKRVSQYGGIPPYHETHAYVSQVIRDFNRRKLAQRKAERAKKVSAQPAATATPPATTDTDSAQ